jgi:hypothetical protein
VPPAVWMPPPPVVAPEIELERTMQLSRLTVPAPVEEARAARAERHGVRHEGAGEENGASPTRRARRRRGNAAKFAVKVTPETSTRAAVDPDARAAVLVARRVAVRLAPRP